MAVPGVAPDGLPRLQEHLLTEVFRVLCVANLVVNVLVDLVDVSVIKLRKRGRIMFRRTLRKLCLIANHGCHAASGKINRRPCCLSYFAIYVPLNYNGFKYPVSCCPLSVAPGYW